MIYIIYDYQTPKKARRKAHLSAFASTPTPDHNTDANVEPGTLVPLSMRVSARFVVGSSRHDNSHTASVRQQEANAAHNTVRGSKEKHQKHNHFVWCIVYGQVKLSSFYFFNKNNKHKNQQLEFTLRNQRLAILSIMQYFGNAIYHSRELCVFFCKIGR